MGVGIIGASEFGSNFASHLILKGRAYYDLELYFSFQGIDNQPFGVAFRYMDPFNYYAVEFRKTSESRVGYKRIIKVVKGNYEVLAEIQDGGYFALSWYNVGIVIVGPSFDLYFKEEKGVAFDYKYKGMEKVLSI